MRTRTLIIFSLFFCSTLILKAQNKKILFGFDEIPQSLMVNPGAEVNYKFHSGIPLLSGVYINAGLTGFNIADLFANDGIDVNSKLRNLLQQTSRKDYYTINQQLELFNIGFRLNNNHRDYISFGFYQELDAILYHPKDIVTLAFEGNEHIGQVFNLSDLSFKAELIGVYHLGINRKINNKLTIGLRGKIYSSVININSKINSGTFTTTIGENNFYNHNLSNVNLSLKTSGILDENGNTVADKGVFGKFLLSGNMGLGIDFGLTYKPKENLEINASMIDLGFIKHSKNVTNYEIKGTQNFEGLNLIFPTTNGIEYWQNLEDEFEQNIPLDTLNTKYTTVRSLKLNGSLAYKFGRTRENNCLRTASGNPSPNEVGIQLFSIFRPKQPQLAATLFYYRRISKFLRTKFTYTVDDFSYTNVGFGFSTHIGKFNLYATADNLIGYTNLSKSNSQSVQFGMNIIFE